MNRSRWSQVVLAGALALPIALGGALAHAQDATPAAEGQAGARFPAAIYEGTCDELAGEPTYQLADVAYGVVTPESLAGGLGDATPVTADRAAEEPVDPAAVGATTLDLNVTGLFAGDRQYAVAVLDPASGEPVVCGAVGGPLLQLPGATRTTLDEVSIAVALREQADSGYHGVAWLRVPEGGPAEGTSTTFTVFLIPPAAA